MEQARMPSFGQLFKKAFSIYGKQFGKIFIFGVIIGVMKVALILAGVGGFVASTTEETFLGMLGIITILSIPISIISFIISYAIMYLIVKGDQNIGIGDSFKLAIKNIYKIMFTSALAGIIIMLGLLFFIVPGIIFSIWYIFSVHIAIDQGIWGMDALKKSKKYVEGRMGDIFVNNFGLGLILIIPIAILIFIASVISVGLGDDSLNELFMDIASFFFAPIGFAFVYAMYKSVKDIKESGTQTPPQQSVAQQTPPQQPVVQTPPTTSPVQTPPVEPITPEDNQMPSV